MDFSSPGAPHLEQPRPFGEVAGELDPNLSPTAVWTGSSALAYEGLMTSARPIIPPGFLPPETTTYAHLPADLQFYMDYHRNHLDHHVYFFRQHCDYFLHTILPTLALTYEPLLFSVAGFAAFQMALKQPDGKIHDFLDYYNQSVTGLRRSLADGQAHSESMILTILQLATIEVWIYMHPRRSALTRCRNTWGTGGIYSAIKKPRTGCSWNGTQPAQS